MGPHPELSHAKQPIFIIKCTRFDHDKTKVQQLERFWNISSSFAQDIGPTRFYG